jgi:hypothetical protein
MERIHICTVELLAQTSCKSDPSTFKTLKEYRHTLRDDPTNSPQLPQPLNSLMSPIGLCFLQIGPPKKAPGPIPLPGSVIFHKFMVIDRPIRLVKRIRPILPSVISQAARYGYASAREQQRLATDIARGDAAGSRRRLMGDQGTGGRRVEKLDEGRYSG